MKTILRTAAVVTLGAGIGGCGANPPLNDDVVAAFYPLAFAAQQIAGPGVHVDNLTPRGAEPHDLEVSPNAVASLREAGHVLLLGHGFQAQFERAVKSQTSVVQLLDTPGLRRFGNGDPHVWLDPVRYRLIVRRIGEVLGRPAAATRLGGQLTALDAEYRRGLANCARHEIVTSHESFAYMAQRYGLEQIAVTGLSPEAEVKPRDLQRTVDRVRASHATTVFFETLVSTRIARTVARETGARTAVLNPIEGLTDSQAKRGEDYFSLMRANLAALRQALGCR